MPFNPDACRRRSLRLPKHDYATPGAYFITICTYGREFLFGEVAAGKIGLNECGNIAAACWREIPLHFPNAARDEFVIMPNHIHGIIILDDSRSVGASHDSPLQTTQQPRGPARNSIGVIVGLFKSTATRRINELRRTPGAPVWQRGYYEHVVRDEGDLSAIREYIHFNAAKWSEDAENPHRA